MGKRLRPPPKVSVWMVAIGEHYRKMVDLTAPRVECYTRLPVNVVTEGDPFAQKLRLLEEATDPVLFIDADAVMLGWDWKPFRFDQFNAAIDRMSDGWPEKTAILSLVQRDWTINSGVWLAPPSMAEILRIALEIRNTELRDSAHPYSLGDQTALNVALSRLKTPVNILHWRYNKLIVGAGMRVPNGTYVAHLVGSGTTSEQSKSELDTRLDRVRRLCERYPL